MKTILDTDVFSEILKAKQPEIRKRAEAYHSEHGRFMVSVITVFDGGQRRSPVRIS